MKPSHMPLQIILWCSLLLNATTHGGAGVVVAWGNNNVNQCAFSSSDIALDIAVCGDQWAGNTLILKLDGSIETRGWSEGPRFPSGTYLQIAAGYRHAIALRSDAQVFGAGSTHPSASGPASAYQVPGDLGACSQVAAGGNLSGALRTGGLAVLWGLPWGNGARYLDSTGSCKQLSVGSSTAVVLRMDNSVAVPHVDGYNFGQDQVPADLGPCTAVAAGDLHVVAIQQSGTVVAWGCNASFQCGTASERVGGTSDWNTDSRYGAYWIKASLGPCKRVSASTNPHDQTRSDSGAIKADGSLILWGKSGSYGASVFVRPDPGACSTFVVGTAHAAAIQVPLPNITGVLPISGPSAGGTLITITGTDFFEYSTVFVGGAPATNVTVVSSTKITATTPPGFPGPAEVKVNLGSAIGFYYRPMCGSDLDQNGEVDGGDLAILLMDWGPCYSIPATPTPEESLPFLLRAGEAQTVPADR